jgi:hypothetical protein
MLEWALEQEQAQELERASELPWPRLSHSVVSTPNNAPESFLCKVTIQPIR